MGMAASQARYLGLTARKTNVEYEGQQVNQQRTALANQSANTFSELLALEVPTAPSTQDFTTIEYTYQDGLYAETIETMSNLTDDDEYNYIVEHYHYADVYTGVESKKANPQVVLDADGNPTYVGNCELLKYDETDTDLKAAYEQIVKDYPTSTFGTSEKEDIYYWTQNSVKYFACKSDLTASATSAPDPTYPTENQNKMFYYEAKDMSKKIARTEKAFIDFDDSGRAQTIRYEDSDATYTIATNTVTDDAAYEDAMNQYNYDVQVYQKAIADINAKTERIQQQDRTLELRLKQLDTEQEALQTEMESVKKVIDKNIEETFKTFQ